MFKAMILLKRKPETTKENFQTWWLSDHAPMAEKLPKLRKAVFNVVTDEDADFDGITELWFDSKADFEAAYASDFGQSVAADSVANVSRRERLLVEEHAIFPTAS